MSEQTRHTTVLREPEVPRRKLNGDASAEELEASLEATRREMSDTISAIERKLSPGEMVDQMFRYYRTGPGEFASNLSEQVKNNPLPVSLIGIGLAWLMMSSKEKYQGPEYTSEGIAYGGHTEGRMHEAIGSMRDKADEAKHALRDRADEAKHAVSDMRHRVSESSQRMSEKAHEYQERMGHRISATRDQASQFAGSMRSGSRHAKDSFSRMLHEQPVMVGAIGLAIGALFGAGLPRSRREDELLGETSDQLKHRAREVGEEQMHKAQQVAEKAAAVAKEEASKQDWVPEEMKQHAEQSASGASAKETAQGGGARIDTKSSGVIGAPVTASTKAALEEKEKSTKRPGEK